MSWKKRKELGIKQLPVSLHEALEAARSDSLIEKAVGSEIFDNFVDLKIKEVLQHRAHVSDWELRKYLSL